MNVAVSRLVRRMPTAAKLILGLYLLTAVFATVWGIRSGVGWWTVLLVALWVVAGALWARRITRSRNP